MFRRMRSDIAAVFERDPAAGSIWEVLWCYPGLRAIWWHRVAHWLWRRGLRFLARLTAHWSRFWTGVEIHPGAQLGDGIFIDHGMGVVIGETAIVGNHVTIYKGVVLGGTGKEKGKRHPTIGDHVVLASNAVVLGNVVIGDGSKVGAGAVVLNNVPPESTVVGVPGRVVRRRGKRVPGPDLDQINLPDPVSELLQQMQTKLDRMAARVEYLEQQAEEAAKAKLHSPVT